MPKTSSAFPKVSRAAAWLRTSLFAAIALSVISCSQAAYYNEYVPSLADVTGIERVAVAEFDGLERSGRMISAELSEGIVEGAHFRLLERAELGRILEERDFNESGVVDPATVSDLKLHGVDGLIFGIVDAYNIDSQTGVEKVEVERGTGKYREVQREGEDGEIEIIREEIKETVTIDRGYVLRKGTLGVTFRMANINTGEIVAIKAETAHFSKRAWREDAATLPNKDMILEELSRDVCDRFLGQIHPRWVSHRVTFEKNEVPATKTGISYAKARLWDKAYTAMVQAARQSPGDPSTHYNVAVIASVLGRQADATESIERAIGLEPKDKYIQWLAHMQERGRVSAKYERQ